VRRARGSARSSRRTAAGDTLPVVRVVLYTGKGGVGKTTTAAATAAHAAARGARALVLSADPAHSLGDVLGERLGPEPRRLVATRRGELRGLALHAAEIDARFAMERHWGAVRDWLVAVFRYQGIDETVAEELALLPGAEELAALLAVEEHARSGAFDLLVVDCAPTGSALRLLSLPDLARGAFRVLLRVQQMLAKVVTPLARSVLTAPLPHAAVFRDAEALIFRRLLRLRRLVSGAQTSVRLVVTPERMVIDEALRAHTDLALFDVRCDAVVMNRLLPEAAAHEAFFQDWSRLQVERVAEVEELFAPLPVLRAPLREDEVVGLARLTEHGAELFAARDPAALLAPPERLRFAKEEGGYRLELPLPHADPGAIEVAKREGALFVAAGGVRRSVPLPRPLARSALASARLAAGILVVRFVPEPAL
jgi:arsenite/tail-anchored protein-transporting ATPase